MSKKQEIIDLLQEINGNLKKLVAINKHKVIKHFVKRGGKNGV